MLTLKKFQTLEHCRVQMFKLKMISLHQYCKKYSKNGKLKANLSHEHRCVCYSILAKILKGGYLMSRKGLPKDASSPELQNSEFLVTWQQEINTADEMKFVNQLTLKIGRYLELIGCTQSIHNYSEK
jgi:hypothetical protein